MTLAAIAEKGLTKPGRKILSDIEFADAVFDKGDTYDHVPLDQMEFETIR